MEFLPNQQQAQAHARKIDVELWTVQHHDELAGEQATHNAQLTELHRCKAALGMEQAATIDFTKAQARARAIAATINHETMPHLTFARASAPGYFAHILHRWGWQGVPSAEGHPQRSHRAAVGEFTPMTG
jgi:hypothetical protein